MKKSSRLLNVLLIFASAFITLGGQLSSELPRSVIHSKSIQHARRIQFDISTFEERDGLRELLSQTTVRGPEGTDFNVNLKGEHFQMKARFLTDLVAPDALQLRADLNTRRLYGRSERNLPLYEEDTQKQTLQINFNEKLVLLPFGYQSATQPSDQLKVEITPSVAAANDPLEADKHSLEIRILKSSPNNLITVEATKSPHRFIWTAVLLENGVEVARGVNENALIEQASELVLKATPNATADVLNNPISVNLAINRYLIGRPSDQVDVDFDVNRRNAVGDVVQNIFLDAAGVTALGSSVKYDLSDRYLKSTGTKYELSLSVKVADQ